jgi:acyl carrier protein
MTERRLPPSSMDVQPTISNLQPSVVRDQLRTLLHRISGGATFRDDEDVFASGVVKSIHLLELIVGVEDGYGLVVDERDVHAGHLRSIDRLVALVSARAGGS